MDRGTIQCARPISSDPVSTAADPSTYAPRRRCGASARHCGAALLRTLASSVLTRTLHPEPYAATVDDCRCHHTQCRAIVINTIARRSLAPHHRLVVLIFHFHAAGWQSRSAQTLGSTAPNQFICIHIASSTNAQSL